MSAQEYKPMCCENFCRYANECNHAANMILTAKTAMNTVVKLKEKSYCTLREAEEDLSQKLCAIAKGRNITRGDDITVSTIKISFNED